MRVVITDSLLPPTDLESVELAGLATIHILDASEQKDLNRSLADADGVIVYHEVELTAETIEHMARCRVIVRGGVGYDNVDIEAAAEAGIPVCNIPDYGVDEVADHTIGQLLALNGWQAGIQRKLVRQLTPWNRDAMGDVRRLSDSTLGIIGCGRIGSAVAIRARAMKLRVLVYDPYLTPGYEKVLGVVPCDLATLLEQSDFVSIHTPLTDETLNLIDRGALRMMKRSAMLINTSRGAVVDTEAVAEALERNRIGGASIDVLAIEPPEANSRLIRLWQDHGDQVNLLVTPHIAYYSTASIREIRTKGAQEVARVLRGEAPRNRVN